MKMTRNRIFYAWKYSGREVFRHENIQEYKCLDMEMLINRRFTHWNVQKQAYLLLKCPGIEVFRYENFRE